MVRYHITTCPCGSGLQRYRKDDGHGIFLFYCCQKCEQEKLAKYRDDILTRYPAEEDIDPE